MEAYAKISSRPATMREGQLVDVAWLELGAKRTWLWRVSLIVDGSEREREGVARWIVAEGSQIEGRGSCMQCEPRQGEGDACGVG